MDVKAVTEQKLSSVLSELRALIRKDKSFDEAKEDLREFLKKPGTEQALLYTTLLMPPLQNLMRTCYAVKDPSLSRAKKTKLLFENWGVYGIGGVLGALAGMPPLFFMEFIIGIYGAAAPIEALAIKWSKEPYAWEKRLNEAETVGYIRMEDQGKRSLFLRKKKLTPVWDPFTHPDGKKDIVGYMKRINGKLYEYRPFLIPDKDTNTPGDTLNWDKVQTSDYLAIQYQALAWTGITYALTYVLTGGYVIPPRL